MPHDHVDHEPINGLPEQPPEGETVLWQGSPDPWRFACRVYALHWITAYWLVFAVWRFVDRLDRGDSLAAAASSATWFIGLAVVTGAILFAMAWATAKAAVYTITNRRVAMRIGVALTVTLNLPFQWIESADLRRRKDGSGDISLDLKGESRLGYLVLWPHAQPWRFNPARPMLRALPNVDVVAEILGNAAQTRIGTLEAEGRMPRPRASDPSTVAAE